MRGVGPAMHNNMKAIWPRLPRRLSIVLALALAGCGPHTTELAQKQEALPARSETPLCRPDPALLVPQSAPDCAFKASHLKTIDPGQWAHLKVAYELKCYQGAERRVRERLRALQMASRCEIQSASR
ncbi:hypothetical protein [Bradyrhizobium sp.]|uniref:hypothetical protein n=1 Tax=Bradyrhizobium sp. TaxID=376 RepID=UPI003C36671B